MDISYITNTRQGLNIGFRNQAWEMVKALQRLHWGEANLIIYPYDMSELPALSSILQQQNASRPHLVIGIANDGVTALRHLPPGAPYTGLLIGHEVPRQVETLADRIQILAIPEHVSNYTPLPHVTCVRTPGVAHTMTSEGTRDALLRWHDKLAVGRGQPVVVVMLGGAVDGKNYAAEEAYRLGVYAAQHAASIGAYLLAATSARTHTDAAAALNQAMMDHGQHGFYMPFKTGKEELYRAFAGMVAEHPQSIAFVTGDSVNMACEFASVVRPSQLLLYPVSNLNPQNVEFVEWMHRTGRAGIVEYNTARQQYKRWPRLEMQPQPTNAADQIAAAVQRHLAGQA